MRMSRMSAIIFAAVLSAAQLSACGRYAEIETAGQTADATSGETAPETGESAAGEGAAAESGAPAGETPSADPGTQAPVERGAGDGAQSLIPESGNPVASDQGADAEAFFNQSGMSKEEAAAFVSTFLEAVKADNREAVAGMIRYPRQVKTPAGEAQVAGAEEFLAYYDEIFTPDFRKKLEETPATDLFCKDGLIGLGDGSVWFYPATVEDDMSITSVNVSADRYVRYGGPSSVQPG